MARIAIVRLSALAGCAAAVGLAGCASAPPTPAPVEWRGAGAAASRAEPPPRPAPKPQLRASRAPAPIERKQAAPRTHPDQPPPDWADGPGVPLSAFALQPEEAQPFDPNAPPAAHKVGGGETVFGIAARYQTSMRALIELNRLQPPFALNQGQVLALPPPRRITAQRGDTLAGLAVRYNIDARSLAYLNRLAAPYVIQPGDDIVLPALARATVRAPSPGPAAPRAAPVKAKAPVKLAWPTRGRILARFGPQPGGQRLDGLDIEAAPGAPVKAAADGTVVYAGDDLPGYGNLVLVQHGGGWVTAYARTQRIVAKEGAKVRQGDVIAEAGGRLHFQLRRGAEPEDPLSALPPV